MFEEILVMATTWIYEYGYLGWEQEIDSHIKTKVMFALADFKKTHLAWYLFAQGLLVANWQVAFDLAGIGERKLDRNVIFGNAGPTQVSPDSFDFNFQIGRLAPPIYKSAPTWASLDLHDDAVLGTTNCMVYIDKPYSILLSFDLQTENKRRTLDIRKTGVAYLLGVERYSLRALQRGPTKAVTHQMDPFTPGL
jgi:hypothetical protein